MVALETACWFESSLGHDPVLWNGVFLFGFMACVNGICFLFLVSGSSQYRNDLHIISCSQQRKEDEDAQSKFQFLKKKYEFTLR